MSAPYINFHTHHIPDFSVETDYFDTHISIVNLDYSDVINPNIPNTYYSIGIHPWSTVCATDAPNCFDEVIEEIRKKLPMKSILCVGESGFDALRGANSDIQRKLFLSQIRLSEKMHKPLIIHCVKMLSETLELYKSVRPTQPWIIHGYRNKAEQAKQLMQHGIYLSFGTKFNEASMHEAWEANKMWLETDASEHTIEEVYQTASDCLQVSVETIKEKLYQQFIQLIEQ